MSYRFDNTYFDVSKAFDTQMSEAFGACYLGPMRMKPMNDTKMSGWYSIHCTCRIYQGFSLPNEVHSIHQLSPKPIRKFWVLLLHQTYIPSNLVRSADDLACATVLKIRTDAVPSRDGGSSSAHMNFDISKAFGTLFRAFEDEKYE